MVRAIEAETFPASLLLKRLVIVASGCPKSVLAEVEELRRSDPRILLIVESQRRGKTEAINEILKFHEGSFLVLLNSDATPFKGSITRLVEEISSREDVGSVSALPTFQSGKKMNGMTAKVLELMWSAHNVSS